MIKFGLKLPPSCCQWQLDLGGKLSYYTTFPISVECQPIGDYRLIRPCPYKASPSLHCAYTSLTAANQIASSFPLLINMACTCDWGSGSECSRSIISFLLKQTLLNLIYLRFFFNLKRWQHTLSLATYWSIMLSKARFLSMPSNHSIISLSWRNLLKN